MENPKLRNFLNEYKVSQDLYSKGEYEKALMQARDTFQKDIEENFNKNMKMFSTFEEGTVEHYFNNILKNITNLRNIFKTTDKSDNKKIKALAKISIEQLINIRNFIEMNEIS